MCCNDGYCLYQKSAGSAKGSLTTASTRQIGYVDKIVDIPYFFTMAKHPYYTWDIIQAIIEQPHLLGYLCGYKDLTPLHSARIQ